jgi:hypothetical protein
VVIFLSKGEREAKVILRMVKYGQRRLPTWLKLRGPRILADNQTEFPFANGSSIESLPSKSDPARGRSVYLVVVDEWAFLENAEDAWASIEPIADVGGRIIGLSTANGYGNFFQELWAGSENGENNFHPIFEPWSARADRDDAWYEAKKKSMSEAKLHQEYPRNPEEAFLKSGNPFFDVERVAAMEVIEPDKGILVEGDFISFIPTSGPLKVWQKPLLDEVYVIGADTAEGLDHGDYSSAHVIKVRDGSVVAHWHGHEPPDEFGESLSFLGRWYNEALLGVEANLHGHTTLAVLKALKYKRLFYHVITNVRAKKTTDKLGWQTTQTTRGPMLDDLATEIRREGIFCHDKRTNAELRQFIRDEKGKLHGSPHDDCVMSLGITNQMRQYATKHHTNQKKPGYWTLGWWVSEQDKSDKRRKKQPRIGANNRR